MEPGWQCKHDFRMKIFKDFAKCAVCGPVELADDGTWRVVEDKK